jgi:hypothetical protein
MLFVLECPGGAEHQPGAGVRVKEEFIEVVQRITGRTVRVFLSAARALPDQPGSASARPGCRCRWEGLTAISDGLAHLHMQYYGKGPTKAKAHFVDDLVVFMLEPEE